MEYDYHVHSTYSDGSDMAAMVEAGREAGLSGVGFADHCNVSAADPEAPLPGSIEGTFRERRRDVRELRDGTDVAVFDAVEMDYRPADAERIEAFLAEAGFEYTVGSVHRVDGREVMARGEFAGDPAEERAAFVDRYFDAVVELVDSELFDVVAHVDVTERNPALRGLATEERYEDVAAALADSRTVPELNAGRAFAGLGEVHPVPPFLDVLAAAGATFATGTDSHAPGEVADRAAAIARVVDERGLETVEL